MEQVSRMAAEVNKLIGGVLIAGQSLYLPEVGSLYIAVNKDGSKKVDFSSAEKGASIVEIIKDRASCTSEQASEIFARWIAEVRTAKAIVIAGVGELRGKTFVAEPEFVAQLASGAVAPEQADETEELAQAEVAPEEESAPESAPESTPESTPTPASAPQAEPKSKAKSKQKAAPVPEPAPKKSKRGLWIFLAIVILAVGGYFAYDSANKAKAEEARIAAIEQLRLAEQQRAADSIAMAQMEAKRLADAEAALLAAKTPRYRVVYGVYELRSNVDVAVVNINAQYGKDRAQEYPFGSYTMVSMFESDTRSECQDFLMEYYDLYPDAWIYDSEQ